MRAEEACVGMKVRVSEEYRILEQRGMVGKVVGRVRGRKVRGRRCALLGWTAAVVLARGP